jgi:hypothetical protein
MKNLFITTVKDTEAIVVAADHELVFIDDAGLDQQQFEYVDAADLCIEACFTFDQIN